MRPLCYPILLCVLLLCGACKNGGDEYFESGKTGECTWTLTEDNQGNRILTISGNGAMGNYDYRNDKYPPYWRLNITKVIINEGVTSIGNSAFACFYDLYSVVIPNSVTHIGGNAFFDCKELTSVTMPDNIPEVGVGVFKDCDKLDISPEDFWKTGEVPLKLDGWYNQHYRVPIGGDYTAFSFNFHDKYNEFGIDDCVRIMADGVRIHPISQDGDDYVYDITGIEEIDINSIRPGRDWVAYSREITLNNPIFHR